ncbi:hypothetical protein ACHAXN_010823 [Cyclotella atomus]
MPATSRQDLWLLVTAHPDDESMFFLPTLRGLVHSREGSNAVVSPIAKMHILCLSNGDYPPSDGVVRTKELHIACSQIGWNCTVLDDKRLKDGPNEVWDGEFIAEQILDCIEQLMDQSKSDSTCQSDKKNSKQYNLNILTFDEVGVSSHPNHIDTFKGVKHLLQEKAKHTRTDDGVINSQLTMLSDEKNMFQLNLHVWTMRTISNPLRKYFFWAFWEMMPQLILFALQLICQLALFLLGSSLWSKTKKQFTSPLVGTKQSTPTSIQYRIMEPSLAWRAMAAHQSQFVWYRRLSVLFSRYTFINNLVQLLPHESYLTHEVESDLPPISIIQEEESTFLLNTIQMNNIREKILPSSLQLRPWKRIYSLSRDGDSFLSFQKLVGEWNSKSGQHCTLLVVKTTLGEVIGAYANVPFVQTVKCPAGSAAGTCLFKVSDSNDVIVYGKNCGDDKRVVLDATRRIVAFGGGAGDGLGLCLNDGFLRGTTARCEAFGNEPLVERDVFEVTDVEVWGFVFGQM